MTAAFASSDVGYRILAPLHGGLGLARTVTGKLEADARILAHQLGAPRLDDRGLVSLSRASGPSRSVRRR
jgi:hypothetical protein